MQIEDQVVSLELAKKLKELGVNQDSLFWWCSPRENFYWVRYSPLKEFPVVCSAFTVAELGEMLPIGYASVRRGNGIIRDGIKITSYEMFSSDIEQMEKDGTIGENTIVKFESEWRIEETEADARAKMLIHLIKNKLIQFKQEGKS